MSSAVSGMRIEHLKLLSSEILANAMSKDDPAPAQKALYQSQKRFLRV